MKYILIALCFLLTACQPESVKPADHVVEQRQLVLASVPETLLVSPEPVKPPSIKEFMKMSRDAREDALTRYALRERNAERVCRADKVAIQDVLLRQVKTVEDLNAAEEQRIKELLNKLNKE